MVRMHDGWSKMGSFWDKGTNTFYFFFLQATIHFWIKCSNSFWDKTRTHPYHLFFRDPFAPFPFLSQPLSVGWGWDGQPPGTSLSLSLMKKTSHRQKKSKSLKETASRRRKKQVAGRISMSPEEKASHRRKKQVAGGKSKSPEEKANCWRKKHVTGGNSMSPEEKASRLRKKQVILGKSKSP